MGRKRKGERADGLIQINASLGRDENGKRVRKCFYGHTRAEAERKRDEYLRMRGRGGDRYQAGITLGEWIDEYSKTYRTGINPLYLDRDLVPYTRLKKRLGEMVLKAVREVDLQAALNELQGQSYSSVRTYRQTIRRIFAKAYRNGLIAVDPSEDLKLPAYTKGTHRELEKWEITLIREHWSEAQPYGLWMLLMLYAGLRRGEMMALQWDAVDMDARTITVRQTAVIDKNRAVIEDRAKTAAGLRILPMPGVLFDALSMTPEAERTGFVCRAKKGEALTAHAVTRGTETFLNMMTRVANNRPLKPSRGNSLEGLPPVEWRLHDLRHTYCCFLYDAGVDVKTAAYLMGHADIRVTMEIYTHLSEARKVKSTDKLLAFLGQIDG